MVKRKNNKIILITIITILSVLLFNSVSLATTISVNDIKKLEYSEKYKEWLNLSEEERKNVMMPNMYDIKIETDDTKYLNSLDNIFKLNTMLGTSITDTKYDLREVIGENLVIKNQGLTNSCWAFASIAALETNLARQDKKEGKQTQIYDFSERHMSYASIRKAFLNDAINEKGLTRPIGNGNMYQAQLYLTNGSGAIQEKEMPFENNENLIDIKEIQNKNVGTTVIDTEILGNPETESEKQAIINDVKKHIKENSGVMACIHGASLNTDCYNNSTGAIYTNDVTKYPLNHGVLIIGWDDEYSKENFNEKMRPKNNGAWIIKNSWGDKIEESLTQYKQNLYKNNQSYFNSNNIYSAEAIPTPFVEANLKSIYGENKIIISQDKITITIGNNGFMYVSYEDVHIITNLYKIVKAKNYKDYDNIYQYDYLGTNEVRGLNVSPTINKGYIANVFESKSNNEEITKISISTLLPYEKCRVYINPNGSSKKYDDLQLVNLEEGEYEKLIVGYNTIEFANPIKITGDSFVIVVELSIDNVGEFYFPTNEVSVNGYENVKIASNKSFIGTESQMKNDTWTNISNPTGDVQLNLTIKAFTNNIKEEKVELANIEIEKAPTKTTYNVGEEFDKTGMIINAVYTNGTKKAVTNYTITNGKSLELNQKTVTISYTENGITKTITQPITVVKPEVTLTKIEIKTKPTKLEYTQGTDDLDVTGGVIKVTYSDGTTKDISMTNSEVTITGYNKTQVGKQIITVNYKGKVATFEITVKAKQEEPKEEPENVTLTKIEIKTKPTKLEYIQNTDDLDVTGGIITAIYSNETTEDILMTNSDVKVTGYNKAQVGKQTITITYKEKTATFEITVKEIEKRTPTLSNFAETKANITKAISYIYSKKDKTEYSTITIKVDGIQRGDKNSTREFYYYLSGKKGETNIASSNWTKFDMSLNNEMYSTNLNIDTRNVKNASEIAKSESLYIYIKEIAKLDGNTTETINTINVKRVADVEVYLDDEKQSNIGANAEISKEQEQEKEKDNTTAKNPIPQTGIKTFGMIIIAILGIGIISYIKYKNIDK